MTAALAGLLGAALALLALTPGVLQAAPAPTMSPLAATGTAWRAASSEGDIDLAFDEARASGRPVLLYWGASWCPPCNRLKSTLFNRAEFVAQSRAFVAVHLDGDLPGAQRLGARFKVRGYPTLVLLAPGGAELTRLPGEGDPAQVLRALRVALAGGRAVSEVLADARAGQPLTASEWRLLAYFSWETAAEAGAGGGAAAAEQAALLAELAAAAQRAADRATDPAAERPTDRRADRAAAPGAGVAPPGRPDAESVTRLWLKALAASSESGGLKPDAALRARVERVLADPVQARRQVDLLVFSGDDLVRALAPEPGAARRHWVTRLDAALRRLQADATLARADRLAALGTRIELARLDRPRTEVDVTVPRELLRELDEQVARDDRTITDGHERQAVVTLAAHVLARAGRWEASDQLLLANLERSHSPYYLMSQLGSNARQRGRRDDALRWFEQAHGASRGPATRLQWGAAYLAALVELAPHDADRIERAAQRIVQDAAGDPAAFHERSGRSLQRVARALASWQGEGREPVLARLRPQLEPLCAAQPPGSTERAGCERLVKAAAG